MPENRKKAVLWGARTLLIITALSIILVHFIFYSYYPGVIYTGQDNLRSWSETQLGYGIINASFILVILIVSWFFPIIGFILAFFYSLMSIWSRGFVDASGVYINISTGQYILLYILFLVAILIYAILKRVNKKSISKPQLD